ncbi:MAG: STAS domain-containing protein [Candidatus Polarisedimenticolia bacterium]
MEIQITPIPSTPGSFGIALRGRISYREAPELREAVLGTLARKDVSSVIVDLAHVDRMDTSGVAVLVEALRGSRKRNVTMMLCAPSPSVIEIFRLAGLNEALRCCCATPDEAHRRVAGVMKA